MNSLSCIEDELFAEDRIELINEKVDNNFLCLNKIKKYRDFDEKQTDLFEKLNVLLDSDVLELLNDYIDASAICRDYERSLAYYLGCKAIMDIGKLK